MEGARSEPERSEFLRCFLEAKSIPRHKQVLVLSELFGTSRQTIFRKFKGEKEWTLSDLETIAARLRRLGRRAHPAKRRVRWRAGRRPPPAVPLERRARRGWNAGAGRGVIVSFRQIDTVTCVGLSRRRRVRPRCRSRQGV